MLRITNAALHHFLLTEIIGSGIAPSNETMARHFGTSVTEVLTALRALEEYHGVVLHPDKSSVWVIHPFSLAPTNFYIRSDRGEWWGNCAWCSLGVAALVGGNTTITTTIGAEGFRQDIHIRNGEIVESELLIHFPIPMQKAWENVIYTCSTMLIFKTEEQIEGWSKRHNIPIGDIQPIAKIWDFAQKWYGNHLAEDWKKWTVTEARSLFDEHELSHAVWNLGDSSERF